MKPLAYHALKARVWLLLLLNRQHAALEPLTQMLALVPGDRRALASRAHAAAQTGQRDLAIADYAALLARSKGEASDAASWFNYGFVLEESGRAAESLDCFRRATAADPSLDRAWYGLGLGLIRTGQLDEAIAALKRTTELQPMSPYGWYQLGRIHADQQRPDEVVKVIRHLKGFEPKVAAQLERETGLQVVV